MVSSQNVMANRTSGADSILSDRWFFPYQKALLSRHRDWLEQSPTTGQVSHDIWCTNCSAQHLSDVDSEIQMYNFFHIWRNDSVIVMSQIKTIRGIWRPATNLLHNTIWHKFTCFRRCKQNYCNDYLLPLLLFSSYRISDYNPWWLNID